MKKVLIFYIVLIFFTSLAFAELYISDLDKTADKYIISFNKSIKISNVILSGNEIKFPLYNEKYKQIAIIDRGFKDYLLKNVKNSDFNNKRGKLEFKINRFEISKHKTIKVFASVIFEDKIEVQCRIMQGVDGLWVAWPANKYKDKWIKEFVFIDKKLKKEIENKLLDTYLKNDGK